jgi:hypothetical protein
MKPSTGRPWSIVAVLCATATAGYMCRVNVSTAAMAAISLAFATALMLC